MNQVLEGALSGKLNARRQARTLRQLPLLNAAIDFCSNDYLGLAREPRLSAAIVNTLGDETADRANGSTGSRLISGNFAAVESLEAEIAAFHRAEAGLMFSTGFAANSGLFACIVGEGDTLITDQLVHASCIDGARLSKAQRLQFKHNDLGDLEARLDGAEGAIIIGVESVYSMDGDEAPLHAIVDLAEQYGAAVIVDEAHSVGHRGPGGAGLVVAEELQDRVFARICTFGKALGLHGAAIVGSATLREYLINFARPFIYSTGPSPHVVECTRAVYQLLPQLDEHRERLNRRIDYFRARTKSSGWTWLDSHSPIQSIIIPGNEEVREVAACLQAAGLGVIPIVAPTVPSGSERIRLSVHAFNTEREIDCLFEALDRIRKP